MGADDARLTKMNSCDGFRTVTHGQSDFQHLGMTNTQLRMLQSKIDARPLGDEFDLKSLWGSDWASVESKQSAGRQFKKAIESGELLRVAHERLDNSPRRDIYKRV